jgi:hypothetical protein
MDPSGKRHAYHITKKQKEFLYFKLVEAVKKENGVQFAYVFGSFNESTPFHDIDVGLYLKKTAQNRTLRHALEIGTSLTNILKVHVDVRILNNAPIPFCFHVIQGRLIFVRDKDIHSAFLENVIRKYLDIKPILYHATKEAFAG